VPTDADAQRNHVVDYLAYDTAEFAEIYDAVFADRDDTEFWRAMAAASGSGPVLEIGCGTGRVLLPLARAGYETTGLDLSVAMIERCRTNVRAEALQVRDRIRLLVADMTSFDVGQRFTMIASPYASFQHLLTVEQQLACLERCRLHLAPRGRLVLDLSNPNPAPASRLREEPFGDEQEASFAEWSEGRQIRWWMTLVDYDYAQQSNEYTMTFEIVAPDGSSRRVVAGFALRYLFRYELEHLLVRAGFRLIALYGDCDRSPLAADSVGMIAVAELLDA